MIEREFVVDFIGKLIVEADKVSCDGRHEDMACVRQVHANHQSRHVSVLIDLRQKKAMQQFNPEVWNKGFPYRVQKNNCAHSVYGTSRD